MIHMRVKVPSNIAGGSLMGAHRFVKSALARANPGGSSSDYKIQATDGTPLTLSDLAARKYDEVLIISGVKSNPSTSSYPVLQPDFNYPSYESRNIRGNDLARLLPKDIDGSMLERLSAEVGTFSALNTITRLMYTNDVATATRPDVAAMLQRYANAGRPARNNPGRAFYARDLNDTYRGILSPEEATKAFAEDALGLRFAKDSPNTAEAIDKAKIVNMYGLSNKAAANFVDHVLTPYLAIAKSNAMLLKTLRSEDLRKEVSKAIFGKRATLKEIDSIHSHHLFKKMTALIPTKAASFYDGIDYAFVAHPLLSRESVAQGVIDAKMARIIIGLVKEHPQNAGKAQSTGRERKTKGVAAATRALGRDLMSLSKAAQPTRQIIFDMAMAQREIMAAGKVEKTIEYMKEIYDPLVRDEKVVKTLEDMEFQNKILYVRDLGGFRPTPPPYWPRPVVLALMDAMREKWEIVSEGTTDFATVFMGLNTSDAAIRNQIANISHGEKVFMMNVKNMYNFADKLRNIKPIRWQSVDWTSEYFTKPFTNNTIKEMLDEEVRIPISAISLKPTAEKTLAAMAFMAAKAAGSEEYFNHKVFNEDTDYDKVRNEIAVLIEQLAFAESSRMRTEVNEHPKAISILSLFMDIEDRARNQYNYNMSENDRAFALYLVETTFNMIRERTPGTMGTVKSDRRAVEQLTRVLEGYREKGDPAIGKAELENRIEFEKRILGMEHEWIDLIETQIKEKHFPRVLSKDIDRYFDAIMSHNNLPAFAKKRIEQAKGRIKAKMES